jgi:hypothetical protein
LHSEPFHDKFAFEYVSLHSKPALPVRVGHEHSERTEINEGFEVLTAVLMKSSFSGI